MNTGSENTDVIILCAGQSKRMGIPKIFLSYSYNENFLEHLVKTYSAVQSNIYIVVSVIHTHLLDQLTEKFQEQNICVNWIINYYPEKDRMYSLLLGLKHCTSEYVFIQNIDNPFVSVDLLKTLILHKSPQSYTRPVFNNHGGHPILIHSSIKDEFLKTHNTIQSIKDILNKFKKTDVNYYSKKILANINTPEDYYQYFKKTLTVHDAF